MPKKSKREKILADIRRRVRTEHVLTSASMPSPIREHESTFHFTAPVGTKTLDAVSVTTSELVAIKKDLTKTVILAGIAITAELALFWFGRGKI
jgi:hypothetical protein